VGNQIGIARPRALIAGTSPVERAHDDGVIGELKIQAVLVLYRQALRDSRTWKLLEQQVNSLKPSLRFNLLVCDNGPSAEPAAVFPEWVEYALATENRGLAWAYNQGLLRARQTNAAWLITLDQDTSLPETYLETMVALAAEFSHQQEIGAIVPQLVSEDGSTHSPVRARLGREQMVPKGFRGIGTGDIRPYNSAAMVRVSALIACGGYDGRFWLDYLDHATFYSLSRSGYRIWIAGDVQIEHHLSLHDDRTSVGEAHFEDFVKAESAFRDLYQSWLEGLLFTIRLLLRTLNQLRRGDPRYFVRSTLSVLRNRLTLSRSHRIARWEKEMAAMQIGPQITMLTSGVSAKLGQHTQIEK
jgi:GT2 family glycosyltransferase